MATAQDGVAFAGTFLEIDGVTVAKITSFQSAIEVSEEQVSGSEDTVGTAPNEIIKEVYKPVSKGETAQTEGIYKTGDQGQSDLEDAAETGLEVQIRHVRQDGKGHLYTGFLTNFQQSGQLSGIYTFSAQFRVNDKEAVDGTAS